MQTIAPGKSGSGEYGQFLILGQRIGELPQKKFVDERILDYEIKIDVGGGVCGGGLIGNCLDALWDFYVNGVLAIVGVNSFN